jgi:hypothetical protein
MKTKNNFSAPLYVKIAAKIVVKYMNKYKIDSFEMTGEKNNKIVIIQVYPSNIYHWILRLCGYNINPSQVSENYKCKQ